MNRECVGSFIRAKRKEKGLTQKQLGDMIGLSDRAVSRWENGESFPDVSQNGSFSLQNFIAFDSNKYDNILLDIINLTSL